MHSICALSSAIVLVVPLLASCGGGGTSGATAADGGDNAGGGDGGSGSGTAIDAAVPDTTSCAGDASACLFGTVTVRAAAFAVTPIGFKASLYRAFPSGSAVAQRWQPVAKDGTWAFGGLKTWAHYYVVIEPGFPARSQAFKGVATRIGPLAVPNTAAAPVDVPVKPAQLDVLQESVSGGPQQVQAASAHLFETGPVDAGGGATVSIVIGAASTLMPWMQSASAYEVTFTPPPSAQSAYQIVTSPRPGAPLTTWRLVADAPQLAGAISSPPSGATISRSNAVTVTWSALAAADYEIVDLYLKANGSWSRVYTSPEPAASDTVSEQIPAGSVAQPGEYLLNVAFAKANCPPTMDGCVEASTVANELLTVQ